MRNYSGTDKRDPEAITHIDYFLRDVSAAMARLTAGQKPTGAGTTIGGGGATPDLSQYLYLPGRTGGQTVVVPSSGDAVRLTTTQAPGTCTTLEIRATGGGNTGGLGMDYSNIFGLGGSNNNVYLSTLKADPYPANPWASIQLANNTPYGSGGYIAEKSSMYDWKSPGGSVPMRLYSGTESGAKLTLDGTLQLTGRTGLTTGLEVIGVQNGVYDMVSLALSRKSGQTRNILEARDNNNTTVLSGIDKNGKFFGDGSLLSNLPSMTAGTYGKLATYTVTSGASRTAQDGGKSGCTTAVTHAQTADGTHDASATTYDELTFTETSSPITAWYGTYAFLWSAMQHDVAPSSTIAFVRVVMKVKRSATAGTNHYLVAAWNGNTNQYFPASTTHDILSGAAANVYVISQTNASGQPWTDAELIAGNFGYLLTAGGDDSSDGDNPVLACEEFYIEAWGAGAGVNQVVLGDTDGLKSLPNGSDAQVLTVVSGAPAWADSSGGLPAVGAEGDVLTVVSGVPAYAPAGAPSDAHYLTTQTEAGLSAETSLGSLSTGFIKGTVAVGVSTLSSVADPLPIGNGGTGQTTLAAAGIPTIVASFAAKGVMAGLYPDALLASAPAGDYRMSYAFNSPYISGISGASMLATWHYSSPVSMPVNVFDGMALVGEIGNYGSPDLHGVMKLHHDGTGDISFMVDGYGGTDPYDFFVTLERLPDAPGAAALYYLNIDPGTGTVTPVPTGPTHAAGTSVVLTPSGGTFVAWTGDVDPAHLTDNPLTIVMSDAKSITATFV